jgi:methyl-accepting chemotaxis protein
MALKYKMLRQNPKEFFRRFDIVLFGLAYVSGLLLYIYLHFFSSSSQILITAIIVSIIVLYAVLVSVIPAVKVRRDQAGDNAYYLGLLFTLSSMAIALYEYGAVEVVREGAGLSSDAAQAVISNFGIALFSTIFGILVRVVLHQMRIDPVEVEAETRYELAEAARKTRSRIEQLTMDLAQFHESVRQRSSDVVEELSAQARQTITSLREELEKSNREMVSSIGELHGQILVSTRELTGKILETANEAQKAMEKLKSVQGPPSQLADSLQRIEELTGRISDRTKETALSFEQSAKHLAEVVSGFDPARTNLKQLFETLAQEQQMRSSELLSESRDLVKQVMQELDKSLSTMVEGQRGATGELLTESRNAAAHLRELSLDKVLTPLLEKQAEAIQIIGSQTIETRQAMEQLVRLLTSGAGDLEQVNGKVLGSIETYQRVQESAAEALGKMSEIASGIAATIQNGSNGR